MPPSKARSMIANDVGSSHCSPKVMVPRHSGVTRSPVRPSWRYCMGVPLLGSRLRVLYPTAMPGEEELIEQRREKLQRLGARSIDVYPARATRTHDAAVAVTAFENWEQGGAQGDAPTVSVAGRITALRDMGKASFLDVRDGSD